MKSEIIFYYNKTSDIKIFIRVSTFFITIIIHICRLIETANGIPRPRPEDFEEKESDEIDYRKLYAQKNKAEKQSGLLSKVFLL